MIITKKTPDYLVKRITKQPIYNTLKALLFQRRRTRAQVIFWRALSRTICTTAHLTEIGSALTKTYE